MVVNVMQRSLTRSTVLIGLIILLAYPACGAAQTQVHIVQSGENLSKIAQQYAVSVQRLIELNDLKNPDRLMPGDRILISDTPVVHVVQKGETLSGIALAYGVDVRQLAAWNGITNPDRIVAGQELVIAAQAIVHKVKAGENATVIARRYGVTVASIAQLNGLADVNKLRVGQELLIPPVGGGAVSALAGNRPLILRRKFDRWPIQGTISSRFGLRNGTMHEGLDIAASHGTVIRAVEAGRVTYADWAGTYGQLVKIEHGGGIETRYAHASQILVRPGQSVRAGDPIARVGSTGRSTGPHLHFEIRVNGEPVDPLLWLP